MSKVIQKKQTTSLKQTTPVKSPITSPIDSASKLSSRKPSISKSTIKMESCSSKTSIFDKSLLRTEPSSIQARLSPKLLVDNLLGGLTSETSLDFGIVHQAQQEHTQTELQQIDTNREKTGDELTDLKEELRLKNLLIEKLTKENIGLRKEVGAFLAITDKIQANLDEERRSYEVRIAALEQENNDLLAENKFYKDQTQRRFKHRMSMEQLPVASSLVLNERSDQAENFNLTKWGSVKEFHSTAGEKMVTFNFTQTQEDLRKSTQYCNTERDFIKENTPSTCRNSKREETTPKKPLFSNRDKLKMSISPLATSKGVLNSARTSMSSLRKVGHNSDSKAVLETTLDKRANMSVSKFKV